VNGWGLGRMGDRGYMGIWNYTGVFGITCYKGYFLGLKWLGLILWSIIIKDYK